MNRRNTHQRQIVLDAVKSRCDHPSAEQIYQQVKSIDPNISLGTVYRNLAVLADEGLILDVKLAGADRYDLTTMPHNHFVCEHCKKVFDIDIPYECNMDCFQNDSGFLIHSHQTIFTGLCPECLEKEITEEKR